MNLSKLVKPILMGLFACLSVISSQAQNKTISGKVTDAKDGSAMVGASVVVKGSRTGTQTGADGTFRLSVPSSATTLVISSVGFGTQEVNIQGKTSVDVSLKASNEQLSDVIVVGYGTRKAKDLTGSVASLSTKDFNKGVISSPEQLFQGRTPGVTVSPSSGEPGAGSTINIRGANTVRNGDPLYVVDGVPLLGGGSTAVNSGVEGSSTPKNPLIFLNPNDIESISILKDASSAAIYGSLGANGVIIITTKNGKGRGAFQFGVTTSISNTAKRYDLLNAQDFLLGVKKANIDAGTSPADAAAAVLTVDKGASTNWQDQIFRTGISQGYNLGWGFSQKGTSLRLSGSYDDQRGIVLNSSLKRISTRANFSQKFANDKLKLDLTLAYSNVKNQNPPNTNSAGYQGSLIGAAITFNPTYPVFNKDGSYYDPLDGNRNPAEMLAYFTDKDKTNRFLTNLSLSYSVTNNLTYKGTIGYDASKSLREAYADPRLGTNAFGGTNSLGPVNFNNPIFGNGRYIPQNLKYNSVLVEHTLTYDKTFKNGSNLNALAGYSYQSFNNYYWSNYNWGLTTPVVKPSDVFVQSPSAFTNHSPVTGDTSKKTTQSYFFRANYIIGSKYYFTGTVRIDGSSVFGKNNKYGTFPAFAFKWRAINEGFAAKSLQKVFSDFSLRANYGTTGSQLGIPIYGSLGVQSTYYGTTYTYTNYNPNLKWESTTTSGVGLDFGLFNNRLKGTVDYFYKTTSNMIIYNYYLPRSSSPYRWENLNAKVINKGLEIGLDYTAIQNKRGFSWNINYNMTFYKNSVKDLAIPLITGGVNGQGLSGAYAQTITSGYSLFTWKMPVYLGLDGNGDARYADGAKDKLLGSPLPTFTAGLNNSFSWKRWNANFFLNASTGFYIYNNTANALFLKGSLKTAHNVTYAVANSSEDPINPGSVSSRFLEKGDFLRLANASLSYTFDMKGKAIKSLTASISGQNLLLFTKYTGLDPEVNVDHGLNAIPSRGFDYAAYPVARSFTAGINIGF